MSIKKEGSAYTISIDHFKFKPVSVHTISLTIDQLYLKKGLHFRTKQGFIAYAIETLKYQNGTNITYKFDNEKDLHKHLDFIHRNYPFTITTIKKL